MKHFSPDEWVDFVNRTAPPVALSKMQSHLDSGCKRCETTVNFWQKVAAAASREESYLPPAGVVGAAKAAYVSAGYRAARGIKEALAQLIFDSLAAPALAGARCAGISSRHLLYRSDRYEIDIQIEATPCQSMLAVTGQLMELQRSAAGPQNVPLSLSNLRGLVVHTRTNQFGEFREELENAEDLELRIAGNDDRVTVISLPNALGKHLSAGNGEWY